ncbi:hypothetical protein BDQ12DRAFT_334544 [Crucibulum laeve]|uniref:Uncharacterized protein n=1 Tax=Crucibulum laeve TaxID=68775 RepID=A0A5C3LQ92_9AGAR|nr:hypothetical protein BDQ12DRAFT_334544 [Crucibulum laeve]
MLVFVAQVHADAQEYSSALLYTSCYMLLSSYTLIFAQQYEWKVQNKLQTNHRVDEANAVLEKGIQMLGR